MDYTIVWYDPGIRVKPDTLQRKLFSSFSTRTTFWKLNILQAAVVTGQSASDNLHDSVVDMGR